MQETEYQKQAREFLEKTGATIKTKFLYNAPYFPDDKEPRDIYEVTIERKGKKPYTFKFGQSIFNSSSYVEKSAQKRRDMGENPISIIKYEKNAVKHHNAYDILACITKYEVGSFDDFCSEFGYSNDSIKARDTYIAVQAEYSNVNRLFGDSMEELQEIN